MNTQNNRPYTSSFSGIFSGLYSSILSTKPRILSTLCLLSIPLLGTACDPDGSVATLEASPQMIVQDGAIFAYSLGSERVMRVLPGAQGEQGYSDLEDVESQAIHVEGMATRLTASPATHTLLAFAQNYNTRTLVAVHTDRECDGAEPTDTGCVTSLEAATLHDAVALSPDGAYAVSYIRDTSSVQNSGVINLNQVGIYSLADGTVRYATVGFNPSSFAFTTQGEPRVVILTSTHVALVNLATGATTTRELTLSSATNLEPQQVLLSGDEQYAFVTINGKSDLYTFDLTQDNLPINILSLSGSPGTMINTESGDATVVIAGTYLNTFRHSDLKVTATPLTTLTTRLISIPGTEAVVAYDDSARYHYLYRYDVDSGKLTTWLLDNPVSKVGVSPDGDALAMFYQPDYSGNDALSSQVAIAVLNLKKNDRTPTPILIQGTPTNMLFVPGAEDAQDLVFVPVNSGESSVLARLNLFDYSASAIDIPPYPISIMPFQADGRMVIEHNSPLGLMSILEPENPSGVQFITHYMTTDLF